MLRVVEGPTVEPVTVAECKAQSVIEHDADDSLLELYISAVREYGESVTNRSFAPQTLEVVLDGFPSNEIDLPNGPISEVLSLEYTDKDGIDRVLSEDVDFYSDTFSILGSVKPVGAWPSTLDKPGAVRVQYIAGWAECPKAIKQWMLVRVASFYAQRENHIVDISRQNVATMGRGFADSLLDRYTVQEAP